MDEIRPFLKLERNPHQVRITRISDIIINKEFDTERLADEFVRLNREVWGDITDSQYLWTKEMVQSHFKICPDIIYCALESGALVATLTNMITTEEDMEKNKTWLEKTGNGFLTTHRPDGDIGFGVDLTVSKKASRKVSDRIVLAALSISVCSKGIKAVYLGSRIPGYHKYGQMPVEEYVFGKRANGKPLDPELYFYLKNGFEIVEIIPEYMVDSKSLNYGVLIKWSNPLYKVTKALPFLRAGIRLVGRLLFH
jgi:hypothetical protein